MPDADPCVLVLRLFPLKGGVADQSSALPKTTPPPGLHPPTSACGSTDPWLVHDPWQSGTIQRKSKWEDLSLPSDHCIHNPTDSTPLACVKRLQLGAAVPGVAFCTKGFLKDHLKAQVPGPSALLLPGNDPSTQSLP